MMRNRVDMEGNIMAAIIGSPTRYIQGKGEMKNLCSYADKFGKNLFIRQVHLEEKERTGDQ